MWVEGHHVPSHAMQSNLHGCQDGFTFRPGDRPRLGHVLRRCVLQTADSDTGIAGRITSGKRLLGRLSDISRLLVDLLSLFQHRVRIDAVDELAQATTAVVMRGILRYNLSSGQMELLDACRAGRFVPVYFTAPAVSPRTM